MKFALLGLGAPLLTACATISPAAPATGGGTCSNDGLQQFVGQPATADLGARVLSTSGAKTLQWVAAGMMVTMDFRADRVRVYLDEQNRVQRLSCG
ncbi:I78 family peptidase inhibitor [Sphingomonas glaciei]|uniref:I78 family peptidase inhibitor n=1 Tax=Sphingomonas glaciei TaxID=2938948 RepID=A0ABY5MY79_9SPHN|nr:I78 family peptidase inhibitor [Sphingomonas glaciei]UUR09410.1 I78 family peptidase inhibitor [Sphingomonas glaciei]